MGLTLRERVRFVCLRSRTVRGATCVRPAVGWFTGHIATKPISSWTALFALYGRIFIRNSNAQTRVLGQNPRLYFHSPWAEHLTVPSTSVVEDYDLCIDDVSWQWKHGHASLQKSTK